MLPYVATPAHQNLRQPKSATDMKFELAKCEIVASSRIPWRPWAHSAFASIMIVV